MRVVRKVSGVSRCRIRILAPPLAGGDLPSATLGPLCENEAAHASWGVPVTWGVTQRNQRRGAQLRASARHRALPPAVGPPSGCPDVGAAEECGAGPGGVPGPRPGKLGISFRFRGGCEHPVTHKPHRTMTRGPRLRPGHRTLQVSRTLRARGPAYPTLSGQPRAPGPVSSHPRLSEQVSRTLRAREPLPDPVDRSGTPRPWTPGSTDSLSRGHAPPALAPPRPSHLSPSPVHSVPVRPSSLTAPTGPAPGWRRRRRECAGLASLGRLSGARPRAVIRSRTPRRPRAAGRARPLRSVRPSAAGSRARRLSLQ